MRKIMSNWVFFTLLLIAGGCTTTIPMSPETITDLVEKEGYVTTTLHSNWKGNEGIMFENMTFIAYQDGSAMPAVTLKMRSNTDFQLLKLNEGHYNWGKISIGNMYMELSDDSGFDVEAGKITYIGDLISELTVTLFTATSDKIAVTDNETENKEKLMATFPGLIDKYTYQKKISVFKPK